MNNLNYFFTVAVVAVAVSFTVRGFAPEALGSLKHPSDEGGVFHRPHPMEKKDGLALLLLCLIYGFVAFFGLGDTTAPQSFHRFAAVEDSVTLRFEEGEATEILWYSGIGSGLWLVELSEDGENWVEQGVWELGSGEQLKWHSEPPVLSRVSRIRITQTHRSGYIGEIVLRDGAGNVIPCLTDSPLCDEPQTAPAAPHYRNSSYFDEVYHARTAYEYLIEEEVYEISHPPLGKGILSLGLRIFGLTPFGWRFMGTLFGVLMLPILYVFLKNLFGRTAVAVCATTVFAFDFMHFVQTRIATIDTYGVFFILLMFWLMYRWFVLPLDAPWRRSLPWLGAAGLAFGVGAACKWTVIYGGAGLALIWLIRMLRLLRREGRRALGCVGGTALLSVLFFVLVPGAVYVLSYQPYAAPWGVDFLSGEYLAKVWDNQLYMFHYHSGLEATHPYQSPWWQWVLDIRPILYYLEYFDDNTKSAFGALGNPLFWWTGLGCMISLAVTTIRHRDGLGLLILIGWLAELLPWVGITRCAFIYHYFPCTVFLALALGYHMECLCRVATRRAWWSRRPLPVEEPPAGSEKLEERLFDELALPEYLREDWLAPGAAEAVEPVEEREPPVSEMPRVNDRTIFVFVLLCLLMFALFYPVLTGLRVDRDFTTALLRWFGGQYPF